MKKYGFLLRPTPPYIHIPCVRRLIDSQKAGAWNRKLELIGIIAIKKEKGRTYLPTVSALRFPDRREHPSRNCPPRESAVRCTFCKGGNKLKRIVEQVSSFSSNTTGKREKSYFLFFFSKPISSRYKWIERRKLRKGKRQTNRTHENTACTHTPFIGNRSERRAGRLGKEEKERKKRDEPFLFLVFSSALSLSPVRFVGLGSYTMIPFSLSLSRSAGPLREGQKPYDNPPGVTPSLGLGTFLFRNMQPLLVSIPFSINQ